MKPTPFPLSRALAALVLLLFVALVSGCGASSGGPKAKDDAITEYGAAVRWSEFDRALTFVDPTGPGGSSLTDLERERYKQLQVTGYEVKAQRTLPDGGVEQDVEIRVVNRNTQIERSVMDHQTWRYDAEGKRFWLVSGLPDFGAAR